MAAKLQYPVKFNHKETVNVAVQDNIHNHKSSHFQVPLHADLDHATIGKSLSWSLLQSFLLVRVHFPFSIV